MKKISAIVCSAILLLAGTVSLAAQTDLRGTINVTVQNAEKQPLEGVSIGLMRSRDSTLAKIGITDQAGNVVVEEIKSGDYFLTAFLIGHEKYASAPLTIDAGHLRHDLPPIQLEKSAPPRKSSPAKA